MKKVLAGVVLAVAATSVFAQYGHHRPPMRHYHGYNHGGWVAPLIIGGIAGAVIARETAPVVVQQPPVIVQQPPIIYQQPLPSNTVIIDGQIYVKQIMQVDGIYREVLVRQ